MSEKITCSGHEHTSIGVGDCVEVSTWIHDDPAGFFVPGKAIGIVLEKELVQMADEAEGYGESKEWLYRVSLPDGRITEVWDYEVKNVNAA